MKKLAESYYSGISNQLMLEMALINSLFDHQGVKGTGNENVLISLLTKFLPEKYGVDTGIIINSAYVQGRQSDIIIYDKNKIANAFSLTSAKFFPIEAVVAVIEVKTTLTISTFREAAENLKSVIKLANSSCKFGAFVFSYQSTTQSILTINNWYKENGSDVIPFVFSLDHGFVQKSSELGHISALCYLEIDGGYLNQTCDSVVHQFNQNKRKWCTLNNGCSYPMSKLGNNYIVVDQAKVLANFLLRVLGCLEKASVKEKRTEGADILSNYFPDEYKRYMDYDGCDLKLYSQFL